MTVTQVPVERDPEFDAWVRTLSDKHWVKYDLSAARLGWEARKQLTEKNDS